MFLKIKIDKEVIEIKEKSVQQLLPIKKIYENGIIELKNNKYIKILKIIPINYNLKSELEKEAILNSYKTFLKTCNFDIQILIQSSKENLDKNILKIQKNIQKKENKFLKNVSEEYINYIQNMNSKKKSSSKNFYIILSNEKLKGIDYIQTFEIIKNDLKEKYFKIKDCLSRCGNYIVEINSKNEIIKILYSFLNTRKLMNKK